MHVFGSLGETQVPCDRVEKPQLAKGGVLQLSFP
jgi:hypothetical protein